MRYLITVMLAIGCFVHPPVADAQNAKRGAEAYKLCASCHGFKAEGSELVGAPGLAAQETWYLERQLKNFRDGIRGGADDDIHAGRMALMMKAVPDDDTIADLAAYIKTLPPAEPALTIDGDVDSGRAYYQPCAACHGAAGEGNLALNAPALVSMQDWYQLTQLEKFKSGARGRVRGDVHGMQMAPMVATLPDTQAMRDVIAYINTL